MTEHTDPTTFPEAQADAETVVAPTGKLTRFGARLHHLRLTLELSTTTEASR